MRKNWRRENSILLLLLVLWRRLRHSDCDCKLSEVHEGGFFLRKNPIRRMVLVNTFPENALRCGCFANCDGRIGGALLLGAKGAPLTGVELNDVRLHMIVPDPAISESVGGNLDLRWTALTPRDGVVKSDIPALLAEDVNGLRLRNVQVDWADGMPDYFSDGIRVENFKDLSIDSYSGRQAQSDRGAAIDLRRGAGVSITNSRAMPGTRTFLQLDQVQDRRVFVNYDLRSAASVITPATQRFETEIGVPAVQRK